MKRIVQFVVARHGAGHHPVVRSSSEGVNWFPTEASQQSKNQFPLFIAITYISFVIFAVVIVAMGVLAVEVPPARAIRSARRRPDARQHAARDHLDGDPARDRRRLRHLGRDRPRRQRGAGQGRPRDHGDRLQLRLRVPLRQRRGLHAQRRPLPAGRRDGHAAHDHAAATSPGPATRSSRSSTASGCRSGGSSRTRRRA